MNITRKITFKRASKQKVDFQKLSSNYSLKIISTVIKSKDVIIISQREPRTNKIQFKLADLEF